ncbi:LOW QUALITY PROTEIN: predicted protein, partial [Brucella abortus bv. 4 str. 292]
DARDSQPKCFIRKQKGSLPFGFFHFFNDNAHHAAPRQNLVAPGKVFLQNMTPEKPLPHFLS